MSLIVLPAAVAKAAAAKIEPRPVRRAGHGEADRDGEHRRRDVVGPHHDYEAQDSSHQRSRTTSSQPRLSFLSIIVGVAIAIPHPYAGRDIRSVIQIVAQARQQVLRRSGPEGSGNGGSLSMPGLQSSRIAVIERAPAPYLVQTPSRASAARALTPNVPLMKPRSASGPMGEPRNGFILARPSPATYCVPPE